MSRTGREAHSAVRPAGATWPVEVGEEAGVRTLHFGSEWVQGAMRIARPWALELDYTRELMAALLLRPEAEWPGWPARVLQVGLGAASITKFLYRHRPEARLDIMEIHPDVVAVARHAFKLPDDDKRIRIAMGDGADLVLRPGPAYDLIVVDGFDDQARAGALDTVPFYAACRARLGERGLLAVNLLSRRRDYRGSVARIGEAFDGRVLAFPSCDSGNAVAFAAEGAPVVTTLAELKQTAQALRKATGLNLLPTLTRVAAAKRWAEGRVEL